MDELTRQRLKKISDELEPIEELAMERLVTSPKEGAYWGDTAHATSWARDEINRILTSEPPQPGDYADNPPSP